MDDLVTRYGKNVDVVLTTIAATLINPTVAVVAALLGTLYAANKGKTKKPVYKVPRKDYTNLIDIVYNTLKNDKDYIRRRLLGYGLNDREANKFVYGFVYEEYLERLIAPS